jgi:hypothetical protein
MSAHVLVAGVLFRTPEQRVPVSRRVTGSPTLGQAVRCCISLGIAVLSWAF